MKKADSIESSPTSAYRTPTEKTPIFVKSSTSLIDQQHQSEPPGHTSWPMGALILLNAIVGAGILTLPYSVLHSGGFAVGLTIEILMGFVAWGSIILLGWLVATRLDRRIHSYQDIAYAYLGQVGGVIAALLICIFYFLICVSYIVAVRDQLKDIITHNFSRHTAGQWFMNSELLATLITLIFIAPWCFVRKIDTLKYISTLASVCIVYLAALVIAARYCFQLHTPLFRQSIPKPDTTPLIQAIFYGCPTFTIAYFFHPPSVLVYDSLHPRTYAGYLLSTGSTMVVTLVVYTLLAAFAVTTFGSNLNEHILLNFNAAEPSVIAGSIFYMIKLILEYPICHFAAREGVMSIIRLVAGGMDPGTPKDNMMKSILATIYLVLSLIIAVFVPSLIVIMQFAGIFVLALVTVIPGACLLNKLRNFEDDLTPSNGKLRRGLLWFVALFFIVFGIFLIILAIIQSVDSLKK